MTNYFVGVDLGQARDFTAIAIVDRTTTPTGRRNPVTMEWIFETRLTLRYLERMPLGTSYPDIVRHIRNLVTDGQLVGRCELVVDATGVGAPVIDLLKQSRLGCDLHPVQITGADKIRRDGRVWKVPKRELIVGLQLTFQQDQLEIVRELPSAGILIHELRNMRVSFTPAGHDTYAAWRTKDHDDLVLAVALATWRSTLAIPQLTPHHFPNQAQRNVGQAVSLRGGCQPPRASEASDNTNSRPPIRR